MLQDCYPHSSSFLDRYVLAPLHCSGRLTPSLALFLVLALSAPAQAATQRRISPFWTSGDCLTTIHLRNNLIDEELIVQPIFHLEDGAAVPVDPITLSPRGSASIGVNDLMASLGFAGRYGGAEFLYEREHGGALNVETEVLMPANDLAYSIESFDPAAQWTNEKHGVFWLPMRTAEVFFAVYNSSNVAITVRPQLTFEGTTSELDEIVLPPNGFGKVRLPSPQPWPTEGEAVGSITIRHDGPAGAVYATGWIDCGRAGYSAMMAFTDPGLISGNVLYGTQIFVGRQHSLRGLGGGADIESYLVLKNISQVALAAEAEIFYTQRGSVGVSPVALGTLRPGEVTSLSFEELQRHGLLPRHVSEASVSIRHRGQEGALMGRVFGISANKTFGFYSKLESYAGGGYDAVHWTTAGDRDSVITVANFGDESDDITVTLAYNGGSLDLPKFTLEPHASETINVRDYARLLPRGVVEGGYAVHGKDRRASKLLTKQHVISAREQVALPFYGTPVYAIALLMNSTSSVTLAVGETDAVWLWMQWSDYSQDPCGWCDASSSNSNIATVTGGGYERTITGVDVGNTTVQASSWEIINEDGDQDYITSLPQKAVAVVCPIVTNFQQSGVQPLGDGSLRFTYTWSSSTGQLSDLSECRVGESVFYPNFPSSPYNWPDPMVQSTPNPTVPPPVLATSGQLVDTHSPPSSFQQPYSAASFDATQRYWWKCDCHQDGDLQFVLSDITITRSTFLDGSTNKWKYKVTKSGSESSVVLPGQ